MASRARSSANKLTKHTRAAVYEWPLGWPIEWIPDEDDSELSEADSAIPF